MHPYIFIGGVDISYTCLEALCEIGLVPALAVGYDSSRASASGARDLGPLAERFDFPLKHVRDVNDPALVAEIAEIAPAVIFVIGWSALIKQPLLELPRLGCVGIHPTQLPEGRGRAPIPWTILKGLRQTASTLFFLTEGIDDGEIIGQITFPVDEREDAGTLYAKHREAHVRLVADHAEALLSGVATATPQDDERATFWPRRRPEDGEIDWSLSAEEIDRLVRAVARPFPGAYADTDEGRLRIWRAKAVREQLDLAPGCAISNSDGEQLIACGQGSLRVIEAELE